MFVCTSACTRMSSKSNVTTSLASFARSSKNFRTVESVSESYIDMSSIKRSAMLGSEISTSTQNLSSTGSTGLVVEVAVPL